MKKKYYIAVQKFVFLTKNRSTDEAYGSWVVTPFSEEHSASIFRVRKWAKQKKKHKPVANFPHVSSRFLLGLLFGSKNGGDIILRNVELTSNYIVSQLMDPYPLQLLP
jgi:hypothetical protein